MSLRPIVARLRSLLDHAMTHSENVAFSPDCVGDIAMEMSRQLESGQTLLLENLRFHAQEEANDAKFAGSWRCCAMCMWTTRLAAAHRAHASTEGITHYVSSRRRGC